MNSTNVHDNDFKIKIGKMVPKNGVNLAYFHNKKITSGDNILVSEPPKNTVDHMTINKSYVLSDIKTTPDQDSMPLNSLYPPSYDYDDEDGYSGVTKRIKVDWTKIVHMEHKVKVTNKTYSVTNINQAPDRIHEPTIYPAEGLIPEGTYDGIQYKTSQVNTVTGTKQVPRIETLTIANTDSMSKTKLPTQSYAWPALWNNGQKKSVADGDVSHTAGNYTGTLSKTATAPTYTPVVADGGTHPVYAYAVAKTSAELTAKTWTATVEGQSVTYHYSGELTTYTHSFHAYGLSRYWSSSKYNSGGYGTADSTYHNPNWVGKGIWSVSPPKPMKSMYNHSMDVYRDSDTYVSKWATDAQGIKWWHDYDKSKKLLGAKAPNGIMWASDYWAATKGKVWPPLADEIFGATTMTPSWYDDTSKLNVAPGQQYSKTAFNGYQHYYRDTIAFYYGTRTDYKAKFVATVNNPDITTYNGTKGYAGQLTKPNTVYDTVANLWNAACSYSGTLSFRWVDWDGIGSYRGIVTKRTGIGNTNPEGIKELTMYPKTDGILYDDLGYKTIESELFTITDVFKDDIPLYYKCRLKYPIYNNKVNLEDGVYHNLNIKLLNFKLKNLDTKKYKYQIKLVAVPPIVDEDDPTYDVAPEDVYYVDIYTSFLVTNNEKIYCSYNAYDLSASDVDRLKPGTIEKLNVQPFFEKTTDYTVVNEDVALRRNHLLLTNNYIMKDSRKKLNFRYKVKTTDDLFTSAYVYAQAVNTKYVLECEREKVIGRNYIVSTKENERYLTAFDIVLKNNPGISAINLAKLKTSTFECVFDTDAVTAINKKDLILFTKQDGSGVVSVETSRDTGVYDPETNEYTRTISIPGKFQVIGGNIYPAYSVLCKDVRQIRLTAPKETETFENWHPGIVFGHFNTTLAQYGPQTRYTYSLPEFNNQSYSTPLGRPYIDIEEEKVKIINEHAVKVKNAPLYVTKDNKGNPTNLIVAKSNNEGTYIPFEITYWSYSEGIIEVEELINDNDNIMAWYTYEEQVYTYRGYYNDLGVFIDLDLNPNQYHSFMDTRFVPNVRSKVYSLFNTSIYFFLKPAVINDLNEVDADIINTTTLYHKFNNSTPNNEADISIGEIFVRNNTSLDSTQLYDSRTRGGGLLEEISDDLRHKLEPESDFYCDIGYYDGEPYSENAVIIIRLNKKVLKDFGGLFTNLDIENAVNKWAAYGVMPIIEYVDVFEDINIPQNTLEITSTYSNQIDYTPLLQLTTEEDGVITAGELLVGSFVVGQGV